MSFDDPTDDDVDVTFTENGEYLIRVLVDDGAPEDNLATDEVTVTVGGDARSFLRCDSNADGQNNLADAVFTLGFLFSGSDPAVCEESMDCNSDATVNLSDPVFDLNFLFAGGPSPTPPYPRCDQAGAEACAESTPCPP